MAGRSWRQAATTLLALLTVAAPAAALGPPAANYRIGADHRGYVDDPALAGPLEERWSRNLGSASSYPVIAGGRVFVNVHSAATGWRLYALDRDTGETLWWQAAHGTPVYDGGRVVVMDGWGVVRAFAEEDGALEWSVALAGGDFAERGLVAAGGRVYVGGHDGHGLLVALDAGTGETLWSRQTFWGLHGRPAVAGGSVYASGGSCGLVFAFTVAGSFRWQSENDCTGNTATAPVVHADRVYVPDDGYLHVFDATTGDRVDRLYERRLAVAAAPTALLHVGTERGLMAQDVSTGEERWTHRPGARIASSPIAVGGRAFVALADGTLLGLSLLNGDEVWRGALRAPVPDEDLWKAPTVAGLAAGEGVLLAPAAGRLVAFAAPTGASVAGGPAGVTRAESVAFQLAGAGLECRLDGPSGPGGWAPCAGEFERGGLGEGAHVFRARAGGPETLRHFTVDRTPPSIEITYQPDWLKRVDMRSDEDVAWECRLASRGIWFPCPVPWELLDEPEPDDRFAVRATDGAGNTSVVEHHVDEDLKAPEIYLDEGPSGTTSTPEASFRFSSSETVAWQCRLDGAEWSACSSRPTFEELADGPHELAVRGVDPAGRRSEVLTRPWIVEARAPTVRIVSGPEGETTQRDATFALSADEAVTFACRLDGGPWEPCDAGASYAGLAAGDHRFEVRATDGAAKQSEIAARAWRVVEPGGDPDPGPATPAGPPAGAPARGGTASQAPGGANRGAPARVALAPRLSQRALARRGLRVRISCPARCRATIVVRARGRQVGRRTVARAAGASTLRIRVHRAALRAKRLRVVYTIRAGDRVTRGGRTIRVIRR